MDFMESSSPSSRPENFPVGLRVLVVDDDPTWLKILEKMLRKCSYEVTTCGLARVALDLIRERKYKFDIVISDVNMPDMDGFKLLEHVGLEMDIPVIMMSVDGETSRVMKGVQHGACDYLLKPIRMKELQNIWQHVYRKKIHEVKEIESNDIYEEIQFMRNGTVDFDDKQLSCGSDISSFRKRKDLDNKDFDDQDDSAAVKKARVVWSVDLHQKFVNAVNQIGFDRVGPKKILDLMNIPGLTRENVASHLQKYRLYLSRLQKQSGGRTSVGNTLPDVSSKNPPMNYTHQNSILTQQNTAANRFSSTTQKIQAQGCIPSNADEIKSTVSFQARDRKEAVKIDALDSQKVSSVSELGAGLTFKGMPPNPEHKIFDAPASKHQSWSGGIPLMEFMQYPKHDHEPYGLIADYSLPSVDHLHTPSSISSKNHSTENQKTGIPITEPVPVDYRSRQTKTVPPTVSTIDSVSVHVNHGVINTQELGAVQEISVSPSINNYCFDQISNHNHESIPELSMKVVSELALFPEDLSFCSPQGIDCLENIYLNSLEFFDSALVTDTHCDWYNGLEVNCEYMYDSVLDECLFT